MSYDRKAVEVHDRHGRWKLARLRVWWRFTPLLSALQEFDAKRRPTHVVERRIQHGTPAGIIISAGIGIRALQGFGAGDKKLLFSPRRVIRSAHDMQGYRSPRVEITITELV